LLTRGNETLEGHTQLDQYGQKYQFDAQEDHFDPADYSYKAALIIQF